MNMFNRPATVLDLRTPSALTDPLAPTSEAIVDDSPRPTVQGKFVFVGDRKLYVRGVTYGAFRPDPDGNEYYDRDQIERDFALMAANGLNAVRIPHTMPPR